jgi:hypothetical protein
MWPDFDVRMSFARSFGALEVCATPVNYKVNGVLVEPFCVLREVLPDGSERTRICVKNEELERLIMGLREVHRVTGGAANAKAGKASEYEKSFGKVGVR